MNRLHLGALLALSACLAGCDAPKRANAVSVEATPIAPGLAPPAEALTFAQVRAADGVVDTLLVTSFDKETIQAVDLGRLGAPRGKDVFDVVDAMGDARLQAALGRSDLRRVYPVADLLSPAGEGRRHVASGTNFAEHAEESGVGEVFNFPKFGLGTPARTTVVRKPGALLDYEVEICARFDRDVHSAADFDAARKGFFVCGDFSERATLMRLVDPDDVESGLGFSDAKSGPGFFPTGPFLVVPRDWKAFVASERMVTRVNGQVRQDARGGEMILDFRALAVKAMTNGGGGRYAYQGKPTPLLENGFIPRGATLMSGTSEGVAFMPPGPGDYVAGGVRHVFTGAWLRGESMFRTVVETFVGKELKSDRYLKEGDVVEHVSSSMGEARIRVLAPAE